MDGGHILESARLSLSFAAKLFETSNDLLLGRLRHNMLIFFSSMFLWSLTWQVVMYFFYKNLTFTLTQFWFTFRTGFSGQRFYDDWFQSLYNVFFTALPVIVLGLFEKVPAFLDLIKHSHTHLKLPIFIFFYLRTNFYIVPLIGCECVPFEEIPRTV